MLRDKAGKDSEAARAGEKASDRSVGQESVKEREDSATVARERAMPTLERGRGADRELGLWHGGTGPTRGTVNDAAPERTTEFWGTPNGRQSGRSRTGRSLRDGTAHAAPGPFLRSRSRMHRGPGEAHGLTVAGFGRCAVLVCAVPTNCRHASAQQIELSVRQRLGYRDDQVEDGRT